MKRLLQTGLWLVLLAGWCAGQSLTLDRGWLLLQDRSGRLEAASLPREGWRPVQVGLSWNAQFADMRDYMGVVWYSLPLDASICAGKPHCLLKFGAVDYLATVFVNGSQVAEHEGGYTPFVADIAAALKPQGNQLLVRVYDPPMQPMDPKYRYDEVPHGKQNWYVQNGGIWQAVRLEAKPDPYIESVRVTAKAAGDIELSISLVGKTPMEGEPTLAIQGDDDQIVKFHRGKVFYGPIGFTSTQPVRQVVVRTSGHVPNPLLWSPDHPSLYTAVVSYGDDVQRARFGFRSFEARDGKFYLNGQPFYMIAALDQDFYPATIYSAPSAAYMREMMLKGKRLGLNTLRTHIKVPDPAYLDAADETGMLIWYEIPSWNDEHHWTPLAAKRGMDTFTAMVARDWNHPSIVIQSIINESWGADLQQKEQRDWLKSAYTDAKQTAPPGRLIVDNSACCDNFHVKTDIADFHQYFSIPDHVAEWNNWTAKFSSRPAWLFSSFGDGEPTGKEPLVLSEFGNWGLPQLPGELPWWFDRDFGGREVTRPAGVLQRFHDYKFDRLFKDFNELAAATEWHQFESLKHEIENIRSQGSIQGYVITEFTDINWESNGLMDMWRNPKVYADELAKIQQPDFIGISGGQTSPIWDYPASLPLAISHYGNSPLDSPVVEWRIGEISGSKRVQEIKSGQTANIDVSVDLSSSQPGTRLLAVRLLNHGRSVAENVYSVFSSSGVGPKPTRLSIQHLPISASESEKCLRDSFKLDDQSPELLVTGRLDALARQRLADGGRVLLLADSQDAFKSSKFKLAARSGSDLDGNWVTNFNWADMTQPPFNAVAFNKILGWEAAAITPEYVLQGIPAANYDDVLAGITYGWLNNNAALAAQFHAGKGLLFVTTFRFQQYCGVDPYATTLLNAMIDYVAHTTNFPKLEWSE